MPESFNLMGSIEEFVNRQRSPLITERIQRFASRASEKWGKEKDKETETPADDEGEKETAKYENPVIQFFSPVGYRPLFEQEVVFLLDEGLSYEDILKMPVNVRKALIERKLEARKPKKQASLDDENPEIPQGVLDRMNMAGKRG
jgi:hypothetical protein